jgi:type III secretion protein I
MEIAAATQALLAAAMPPATAAPTAPAAPSALVTERFNAMMNAPDATQAAQTAPESTLQQAFAAHPSDPAQGGSLGSQILAGLQSSATQISQQWQTLAGSIDRVALKPSVGDLLQVQAQIVQAEVQYDLVSKTVSKATSNIDTLVRMS